MPPVSTPKPPEPEDIFAKANLGKGGPTFPNGAETVASIAESPGRGLARKLVRLIFFALGAAIVVIAGYFGYQYFLAAKPQPTAEIPNSNNQIPDTNGNGNIPVSIPNENGNLNIPPVNTNPVLAPQDDPSSAVDTDGDGLTDYQESHAYGTELYKTDSDDDGLSDRDEVVTWHTDPRNVDTDGDTYTDGQEVQSGYNPLGNGKLTLPITQ